MDNKAKTILAVDDEFEILKVLQDVFGPRGWNVITTPTGNAVWNIIAKNKVDLILLDLKLPDISGFDVLKELKVKAPHIPVIIFTAWGYEEEFVNKAMKLGAKGYVSKIVPIRELVETVNNVMVK